jgi:hypothetical protein
MISLCALAAVLLPVLGGLGRFCGFDFAEGQLGFVDGHE